jgi:hypothetical protein
MTISKIRPHLPLICVLAVFVLGGVLALTQEQLSLGEIARKNRAAKKTAQKVVTEEDMPTRPPDRSPTPSTEKVEVKASDTPAAERSEPTADASDGPELTDDAAKRRPDSELTTPGASAQQKVEQLKELERLLVKKIAELEQGREEQTDQDTRAGYSRTIEANKQALATTREQLTAAEKEVAEAEK